MGWGNFVRYFIMIIFKCYCNSEYIMRKYIIYIEFCNFLMIGYVIFILKILKI